MWKNKIDKIGILLSLITTLLFAAYFPFVTDPVHKDGSFLPPDNRENRLDSLSHEQTLQLQTKLIIQTRHPNANIRSKAIGQLVTTYRKRTMIKQSLHWLKIGLREFPHDKILLQEKKEMQKIILRNR